MATEQQNQGESRRLPRRSALAGLAAVGAGFGATSEVFRSTDQRYQRAMNSHAFVDAQAAGADGTGKSDSSMALQEAILSYESPVQALTIYFPTGIYRIAPGILSSSKRPLTILGDGIGATKLVASGSSPGALVDLRHERSLMSGLTIDAAGVDAVPISINASYCTVENFFIINAGATSVEVGRYATALIAQVRNGIIRSSGEHGLAIRSEHSSTDCLVSCLDIGRSGASGVFLESGSHMLSSVHVWASGRKDIASSAGFEVTGKYCQLDNCQSETNSGSGILINRSALSTTINGGRAWGNGKSGLEGSADRLCLTGMTLYRNGWAAQPSSPDAAAILNRGGASWRLAGLNVWDDNAPVTALAATRSEPIAILGRDAGPSQSYAVASLGVVTDVSLLRTDGADTQTGLPFFAT